MDGTLRDGCLLLRYVSEEPEKTQHSDGLERAVVKLHSTIDSGAVLPAESSARVPEDTTDERTVNVLTLIECDGFIRSSPFSFGPHTFVS